jgi:hypothetical protein
MYIWSASQNQYYSLVSDRFFLCISFHTKCFAENENVRGGSLKTDKTFSLMIVYCSHMYEKVTYLSKDCWFLVTGKKYIEPECLI